MKKTKKQKEEIKASAQKEEIKIPPQVNLRIKDGEQFFANESGINFNPNEFVLDFKCVTHTNDLPDRRGILLRHNLVILTPFHAKNFLGMIARAIKDYETKFEKIEKPESIRKAENLVEKEQKKSIVKKSEKDSYFG